MSSPAPETDINALIEEAHLHQIYQDVSRDPVLSVIYPSPDANELNSVSLKNALLQTYGTKGRAYHAGKHAIAMAKESGWVDRELEDLGAALQAVHGAAFSAPELKWAKDVKRAAFIAHDMAYLNVDGELLPHNSNVLPYLLADTLKIDRDKGTAEVVIAQTDDTVVRMVNRVFGFDPADPAKNKLTQVNGLNEYISALSEVKRIEEAHKAAGTFMPEVTEYMLAMTAAIAATVPFRDQAKYDELGERVKAAYAEFLPGKEDAARRIDIINGVSAIVANQDVLSFTGNRLEDALDPEHPLSLTQEYKAALARNKDDPRKATEELTGRLQRSLRLDPTHRENDARVAMAAAEDLRFEEGKSAVKRSATPGEYTAEDAQFAVFKRSRVYRVAKGKLYHHANIGEGAAAQAFPPKGVVEAMNRTAFDNGKGLGDITEVAADAQNAALGVLRMLATEAGKGTAMLKDLSFKDKIETLRRNVGDEGFHDFRNVHSAHLLGDREHGFAYDIKQSPIAAALVKALKPDELQTLYNVTEWAYGVGDKAPFLPALTADCPKGEDVTPHGGAATFRAALNKLPAINAKLDRLLDYMAKEIAGPAGSAEISAPVVARS